MIFLEKKFPFTCVATEHLCRDNKLIQWGSEYRTSLVFEWSKVVRSPNCLFFECHLNTGLNLVWYSDHHLYTGPVLKWWLNTEPPFEYQTSEYRTSESSLLRCFRYSDVTCKSIFSTTTQSQKWSHTTTQKVIVVHLIFDWLIDWIIYSRYS